MHQRHYECRRFNCEDVLSQIFFLWRKVACNALFCVSSAAPAAAEAEVTWAAKTSRNFMIRGAYVIGLRLIKIHPVKGKLAMATRKI